MAKIGNETNHTINGLTVVGGLVADQISVGPNGALTMYDPPGIIVPVCASGFMPSSINSQTANSLRCTRYIFPKAGSITYLALWVSTQSGHVDVAIYDCAATTRTRQFSSGSTAVGAQGWQTFTLSTPLPVFAGQCLDIGMAADNGTATFGQVGIGNTGQALMPFSVTPWMDAAGTIAGTTNNRLVWVTTTSFPAPATVLESAMATNAAPPHIFVRVQ